MPSFLSSNTLRIFQKNENLKKEVIYEKLATMKYTYEHETHHFADDDDKSQHTDFALCYTKPELRGRYTLIAMVYFLLEVELKILNKDLEVTDNDENEYKCLLNGIKEGLDRHYQIEPDHEETMNMSKTINLNATIVDCYLLEKFLVHLDYLDTYLNEREDYNKLKGDAQQAVNNEMADLDEKIKFLGTAERHEMIMKWKKHNEEQKQMIADYKRLEILAEGKVRVMFDLLKNFDIVYDREELMVKKGLKQKIPKSRYYINFYNENIEKDIWKEKYATKLAARETIHETEYRHAPLFQNMDPTQAAWVKRPDLVLNGLRPTEELVRKDGTIVDKLIIPNEEKVKTVFRSTIDRIPHFLNTDL